MDTGQFLNLRAGVLYLPAHAPILHDAFLRVLNVDVLLHADVFFYKILQFYIHAEGDGPLKQQGEFLRIQSSQISVIQHPAEPFVVGGCKVFLLVEMLLQIGFHL